MQKYEVMEDGFETLLNDIADDVVLFFFRRYAYV